MPKLPKKVAQAVDKTESSTFELLPVGVYEATLEQVTTHEGKARAADPEDTRDFGENELIPYWKWQFMNLIGISGENIEKGKVYPGKMWVQTSLGKSSRWKVKEVFDAFGYSSDSDTDEMCGEKVRLVVSQGTIGSGPRQGEPSNTVDRVMPLEPSEDEWTG